MKIKDVVYEDVQQTIKKTVQEAVYGCDECRKEVNQNDCLIVDVFYTDYGKDVNKLEFCSWECLLKHLPKIKTDNFISLPFVMYDKKDNDDISAKGLINLLKEKFI